MNSVGIAPPSEGKMDKMDINIETAENGLVVRTSRREGEGEDSKYISETYCFNDLDEFNEWFQSNGLKKKNIKKNEKGVLEIMLGEMDD